MFTNINSHRKDARDVTPPGPNQLTFYTQSNAQLITGLARFSDCGGRPIFSSSLTDLAAQQAAASRQHGNIPGKLSKLIILFRQASEL